MNNPSGGKRVGCSLRDVLPLAHQRNPMSPDWQLKPQIGLPWMHQHMCSEKIMLTSLRICLSVYKNAHLSVCNGSQK